MILLPDVRQKDDYTCGIACIETVCRYWGKRMPASVRKLASPQQGLRPDTLEAAMYSIFHTAPLRGTMSIATLHALTSIRKPVICLILLYGYVGHWVVVRGVHRGNVYFHCPVYGKQRVGYKTWLRNWNDEEGWPYYRFGLSIST